MKKILILLALIGVISMTSCEKITKTTWVHYNETWCQDPWGNSNIPDKEKIANIKSHLIKQKIKVFEVDILQDGAMDPCDACHCLSGKLIKGKIKADHLDKALGAGFYQ